MRDFLACLRQLFDRVSGREYRRRLQELHREFDSLPITSTLDLKVPTTDILLELQDTKKTATGILESLVKRSEIDRRRLELIFDDLSDAIILTSEDGTITAANLAMRSLFDMQTNRLLGCPVSFLFPKFTTELLSAESLQYLSYLETSYADKSVCHSPTEVKPIYADYVRKFSQVLNQNTFTEYKRTDGVKLSLQITVNVLTLEPCAPEFNYIFVVRDLTEQRKVEDEVAHLRSVASSLMSVAHVPVFYKGLDLKFTDVNKPFRDLLDVVDDDIVGKTVDYVFDSDSAEKLTQLDAKVLKSEHMHNIDVDLKTLRGVVRSAKVVSKSVRNSTGVTGLAGSIITSEEPDIQVRNEVFTAASKAIVFLDSSGLVTGCNDEFVRLTKLSKSDLIGLPLADSSLSHLVIQEAGAMLTSDVIQHTNGTPLCRLYAPIVSASGVSAGAVYIFFVHLDK